MNDNELDLQAYCAKVAQQAKAASSQLACTPTAKKNEWLLRCADSLVEHSSEILRANELDLKVGVTQNLSPASMDRLTLNSGRIEALASALREIAKLDDPVGELIEKKERPNGLLIQKVRVPLGVVFFIYEARPNVTADAAAICIKSGNAVILRSGKEAFLSSQEIVKRMNEVGEAVGIPTHSVQLVEHADRSAVDYFLGYSQWIDLAIPRGGKGLIERVARGATMPVMKHFDGNCHVYVDSEADLKMAVDILENAKCQRMGVCNACESLLIHRDVAETFLPMLVERLNRYPIELRGDSWVCKHFPGAIPATEEDWSTEYLGPILSVKIVESSAEAIDHINLYGSHHTDAIVTRNEKVATLFAQRVDSAAVVINASTRFNDGGELGLGAEIGISTDKFHARGPCGLRELTSYKYVLSGNGQVRT